MKFLKYCIFVGVTSFAANIFAWDGATNGVIFGLDVAPGENYGIRISLKNLPKLCGNEHAWAYLNESDSNYKTFVSVLLAAKLADKPIAIFTSRETTSGNGYCHIGYIQLQ
jgi:hypothetical protein